MLILASLVACLGQPATPSALQQSPVRVPVNQAVETTDLTVTVSEVETSAVETLVHYTATWAEGGDPVREDIGRPRLTYQGGVLHGNIRVDQETAEALEPPRPEVDEVVQEDEVADAVPLRATDAVSTEDHQTFLSFCKAEGALFLTNDRVARRFARDQGVQAISLQALLRGL